MKTMNVDPDKEVRPRNYPGTFFFGALTLFLWGMGALCLYFALSGHIIERPLFLILSGALAGGGIFTTYETISLWMGWEPITEHTRRAWHQYPKTTAVVVFICGIMCGGFFMPDLRQHGWWVGPIIGFVSALFAHFFVDDPFPFLPWGKGKTN